MTWLILLIMPTLMFVAVDLMCRGTFRPPALVRRLVDALRPRTVALRSRARRGERLVRDDVFQTFHLQTRLGAVADEIRRLESDRDVFARAHRLRAARGAYDGLLAEACRAADVRDDVSDLDEPDDQRNGRAGARDVDAVRMHAELELASRGWSW